MGPPDFKRTSSPGLMAVIGEIGVELREVPSYIKIGILLIFLVKMMV